MPTLFSKLYDISPGWHTTIHPFNYFISKMLTILALVMLICFILIKVLKIEKEKYQRPINIVNLIFCILCSTLIASYLSQHVKAIYSGFFAEQLAFFSRSIGSYWFLFLAIMWIPLLLTQPFWRKKNRININRSLLIVFIFNLHLWFEGIYIFIVSLTRN